MAQAATETWTPLPEPLQNNRLEINFSDAEEEDADDKPNIVWYKFEIKFGKFKGTKLNKMITSREGRSYLRWLKKQTWCRPYTSDAIDEAMMYYYNLKMKKLQSRQTKRIIIK